jgi:hypothetical protein
MKINLHNNTYQINIEYLTTGQTLAVLAADYGKSKPTLLMAEALVTRHHSDPPRSKAKRRTFAIAKLLRKTPFSRAQRAEIWQQLWGQMNVPAN